MARESSSGDKTYLVVINQKKYEIKEGYMMIAPTTPITDILGATNSSSYFGTGASITLDGTTYTLIMLGDVSGDGRITPSDYVKVRNKIMQTNNLSEIQNLSADVNKDGQITPSDYVKIRNQIMGSSSIKL